MSGWTRRSALGLLLLAGPTAAQTTGDGALDPPSAEPDLALRRARARESFLAERSAGAQVRARAQALATYRLLRRRGASFLGDPSSRLEDARRLDAALWLLARETDEAAVFRAEVERAARDRQALESPPPAPGAPIDALEDGGSGPALPLLHRPVRGTLVAAPGLRRDEATQALLRQEGIRILGRLNDPASAPAAGRVQRVAPLPQGGFAVVIAHEPPATDGSPRASAGPETVSILSGLRQVDVAEGSSVERGQRLGLVGRGLDGAPVVGFELWHRGSPIDPRRLLGQ